MKIWTLVDIEPGFEEFRIGDQVEVTPEWYPTVNVPSEIVARDVPVIIKQADGYWVAQSSSIPLQALLAPVSEPVRPGPATISGCLAHDRYMRYVHPGVVPVTRGLVQQLGVVAGLTGIGGPLVFALAPDASSLSDCRPAPGMSLAYYCVELLVR